MDSPATLAAIALTASNFEQRWALVVERVYSHSFFFLPHTHFVDCVDYQDTGLQTLIRGDHPSLQVVFYELDLKDLLISYLRNLPRRAEFSLACPVCLKSDENQCIQ